MIHEDDEYLTVAQLSKRYPVFTVGSIRHIMYKRHENGFNRCIRKIGKKVIISVKDFKVWLDSQTAKKDDVVIEKTLHEIWDSLEH